ncbi:sugar ABC transporter ATP-binding protein [Stakelama sp. CBK3Z-3]|uniref:Sugar ABC transporter ATP-binding protein n=1 Tax=Stakelama flava TaxID=2860338 RepID=A0ABS6XQS0_9SPHN|nr:sugar ABC transporter ATP-binding protein [Stakelama flava]MBW4331770.1 sugar ABC transporter ATP-binding protein [Stakelama flava]
MVTHPPLLSLDGVTKTFPNGTVALAGVDLDLRAGRVHGLLGANGAGKSTLIKILSGALPASGGAIRWHGEAVRWTRPRHPREAGVATIYQHIPLVPTLSALENILLDERGTWRNRTADRERIGAIVSTLGHPFDLNTPVAQLPIGARQMVAIAQALAGGAELVVMDEPTASLAGDERQTVYRTIRRLAYDEGKAILFVSHFLDEIMALTDEVTVLRDGRAVLHAETDTLDEARIAEAIAGRAVAAIARPDQARSLGEPRLEVQDLRSPGKLSPVSFTLHTGEVLGIAGVLGSGRSELMHAVFGSDPDARGQVLLDGETVGRYPDEAVAAGLALVPEDRAEQGYVPQFSLAENIALARVSQRGGAFIDAASERADAKAAIDRLSIKAPGGDALVTELSGGNAQKVVVAKWLTDDTRVLLLDEPTAGIDIGARTDILKLVRALADGGLPVMLVSSEFEELLAICDRILVMRDGRMIGQADPYATSETDLTLMTGGTTDVAAAGANA